MAENRPKSQKITQAQKLEMFAQEFVATKNAAEAYRRAFKPVTKNKFSHRNYAERLKNTPEMLARIREIQTIVETVGINVSETTRSEIDRIKDGSMSFSRNDILAELHKAYHMAEMERDYSAMQTITAKKASILGLGLEENRRAASGTRSLMEYSDDELRQLTESSLRIAADLTAGLTTDPASVATSDEDGKSGVSAGGDKSGTEKT